MPFLLCVVLLVESGNSNVLKTSEEAFKTRIVAEGGVITLPPGNVKQGLSS